MTVGLVICGTRGRGTIALKFWSTDMQRNLTRRTWNAVRSLGLVGLLMLIAGLWGCAPTGDDVPMLFGGTGTSSHGLTGFGSETIGGLNGRVIKVTNLNNSGPGSLRDAVAASDPRLVVFEVSGTIELESKITVRDPYITVAGQTAPSPGITLKNYSFGVTGTHDVVVQHIRVRVGDERGGDHDGMSVYSGDHDEDPAYNVVYDHCSISWSNDENMDTWYKGTHDITFSNNINSEALFDSHHSEGAPHSMGMLIGYGTSRISVIGNLLAHNSQRNLALQGPGSIVMANNVLYNYKGYGNGSNGASSNFAMREDGDYAASLVGNVYIAGADTRTDMTDAISSSITSEAEVYLEDNYLFDVDGNALHTSDPWSIATSTSPRTDTIPIWPDGFTALPADQVEEAVSLNVGARPADRDAVDIRIIQSLTNRNGRIIDSQDEVGGWPDTPGEVINTRTLNPPDSDRQGWLDAYTAQVEVGGTPDPDPDPDPIPDPDPDPIPSDDAFTILRAPRPPVVDGDLADFAQATSLSVQHANGTLAKLSMLWDDDALYFGLAVDDSSVEAVATAPDGEVWSDDGIELMFDPNSSGGGGFAADDLKFIINAAGVFRAGTLTNLIDMPIDLAIAVDGTLNQLDDTDGGYVIEASVLWSDTGMGRAERWFIDRF